MSTKALAALAIFLGVIIVALVVAHFVIPFEKAPVRTYTDPVYGFMIDVPDGFYEQKPIGGLYAYSVYFTSADIQGNYIELGAADVQLLIRISRDGNSVASDLASLEGAVVLSRTDVEVSGTPAVRTLVDATALENTETGCSLETAFMKAGRPHVITLTGTTCEALEAFETPYERIVGSFTY